MQQLMNKLWDYYSSTNSQAYAIHQLLIESGETVVNDHIAFRTINNKYFGIDAIAKFFSEYGYEPKGDYHFKQKKLRAKHYEHQSQQAPKIFISELLLEKCSTTLQHTLTKAFESIPKHERGKADLLTHGRSWDPIDYRTYQQLLSESEYAAWLYCFGICPNHFTISINHLKKFQNIKALNQLIKGSGFKLNQAGGEIKGKKSDLLQQSSTLANEHVVQFLDGKHTIPYCYYEFALRHKDKNGTLYQGFITKSADKLFESTDPQN